MHFLQRFQQYILDHRLFSPKDTLLLAVSGGLDSVVLCELCKQCGFSFIIAHCNFKLRGAESERDAAFVGELAEKYNVQFFIKEFDTQAYAESHKLSIQEAARDLRYSWFRELLQGEMHTRQAPLASCLLTAHHLDDNIETMLLHFFRGTGVHGLRGMLPKQSQIVRPLLFARKQELQQFAIEHNLQWVEDSSNALDKYSRNYFRHQLIPLVQKIFPEAENNLAANLRRFAEMELLYDQAVHEHKKKLLEYKGQEVHIPVLKLQQSQPLHTIVYEIIKEYGYSAAQVEEVIRLLDSESGRYVQSATHRIIRNRRWLIIAPVQSEQAQTMVIDEEERKIVFENGTLLFEQLANKNLQIFTDAATALIDRSAIQFPLLLRRWKKGDYFYPLGLRKKKKLARFFIDQKLSLTDKEKVWVLESNKKIVWVVGLRIDDRFKITDATKKILKIQFEKS
ncbi:tRNA lysidine(34) synthetase TilS [Longitalea arenae]|uniref:tRNA lysidine(34) synthetase TilS n=1 Tax=Longitalea arenae TaxID=2812558 RepID=UPI0019676657|nr:tRNA lysidine(34) synthetase TilS [Longitalea arenae]